MKYYGQSGLDEYIHKNFIKSPVKDGTFLELGALDGIRFSNTKFFEDNMGFDKGVLIEPDRQSFDKLVSNRPNCECFNYAIHSSLNKVNLLTTKERAVCVIDDIATDELKKRWHKKTRKVPVPAAKLSWILEKSNLEYIDFWSLDVEGAELECLLSMNWELPVGLLCIEINQHEDEIDNILTHNGLTLAGLHEQGTHVVNRIYINNKYFRSTLLMS